MDAEALVKLEGLEEIQEKFGRLASGRVAPRALLRFARDIEALARPYPEEGEYNRPGAYPKRWYQRLFGPRWALKAGGTGGRNTSERMQYGWAVEQRGASAVVIGNRASYAPFVAGEAQQDYHAAHGWRKLTDIIAENKQLWQDALEEEIAKEIGR